MNNKCTIVVNSCDKYEDAWYPFFELVKLYWKDCPYPFILNTEKKNYAHPDINITCINQEGNDTEWGQRLINVLEKIDSEYVLLLLEDFFMLGNVKQEEISKCVNWMEKDQKIAAFYFKRITGYDKVSNSYPGYIDMKENAEYKLNCQAGLWNREILINLLDPNESPWQFEEFGYKRLIKKDLKFYCSSVGSHFDSKENVFNYLVARDFGYGIWKGKWLWNNNSLFKTHGIKINRVQLKKMTRFNYFIWKVKEKIRL